VLARLFPATVAGTALLATIIAAAPAQAATPAVQIVKVWYDSPGADRRSNASLNAEYVTLKNTTARTIQMEDWILRDKTGYKYRFLGFALRPGKTVTVRSGSGNDGSSSVFWNRRQYVWNNTGDTAGIYRAGDLKRVDTCSWGRAGKGWTSC